MIKARGIILELYKQDKITKEEVDILLDAIDGTNCCYKPSTLHPYWEYRPMEQPSWTITTNTTNNDVE